MQVNMKTNSDFIDSRAQEFMNILRTDNNEELLNLYYNYKGFHTTGTADFVQTVVVEFMETYCIEIKTKYKIKNVNNLSLNRNNRIKNSLPFSITLKDCSQENRISLVMIGMLTSIQIVIHRLYVIWNMDVTMDNQKYQPYFNHNCISENENIIYNYYPIRSF